MNAIEPRGRMFQDQAFIVGDLAGSVVEKLLGFVVQEERGPSLFLLKLGGRHWQRFFLDVGFSVWEEWGDEVIADDFAEELRTIDYTEKLGLGGATVEDVRGEPGPRIRVVLSCGEFVVETSDEGELDPPARVVYRRGA